jgi:death-on-curing protein
VPPPVWQPTLEDYLDVAGFLLAATPEAIRSLPRIGSAESAIHAPFASFGGPDAYPHGVDRRG